MALNMEVTCSSETLGIITKKPHSSLHYCLFLFFNEVCKWFHYHNYFSNEGLCIGDKSFDNVAQFKYLGMTVTKKNLIQEEEIEFG
jgi:hypothetical protein